MRLKKGQKEALLEWIAEGLESDEINKRAAKFKPRFNVSRRVVTYYRKSREVKLEEIKETGEASALTTGLATRAARVDRLQKLADLLIADLFDGNLLWTNEVKGIGGADNFERIDYKEFNKAEVDALRGVLDDIASEVGERQPDVQVNNTFNFNMEEWKKARRDRLKAIQAMKEAD
jgi:hypothetical protein